MREDRGKNQPGQGDDSERGRTEEEEVVEAKHNSPVMR